VNRASLLLKQARGRMYVLTPPSTAIPPQSVVRRLDGISTGLRVTLALPRILVFSDTHSPRWRRISCNASDGNVILTPEDSSIPGTPTRCLRSRLTSMST